MKFLTYKLMYLREGDNNKDKIDIAYKDERK